MKKILLSGIALIAACHIGFAQNFLVNGFNCEYVASSSSGNNLLYILSTEPNSQLPTQLVIPSTVTLTLEGTYTVTDLGNNTNPVFSNGPALVTLTTPSTLQRINSYSCAYLTTLYEVIINGSPTIEPYAFLNDPNLVNAPSICNDIGDSAFEGCTKLRNVGLKDGVTKIGKRAFANCKSLRTLTIPKTVVTIAPDAFDGSGIKSVVLERGNAPLKFSKGIYVTVKQLPYPKK
jgi:hypothetical protein